MSRYCLTNGIWCQFANEFGYCSATACRRTTETAKWNNVHSPNVVYNITTIKTNSGRIRAMTDDQLADFFYGSPEEEFGICYYCKNFGGAGSPEPCKSQYGACIVEDKNEAFKKWLKQPVDV